MMSNDPLMISILSSLKAYADGADGPLQDQPTEGEHPDPNKTLDTGEPGTESVDAGDGRGGSGYNADTKVIFHPHIERHIVGDDQSGSKMSREVFEKAKPLIENDIKSGNFVEGASPPGNAVSINLSGAGMSALKDGNEASSGAWDSEFEGMRESLKELGAKAPSKHAPGFTWEMRENAAFPILVNRGEPAEATNTITAIVYPQDLNDPDLAEWHELGQNVAFVLTIYPGKPAPPIAPGTEDFWRNHYFAGA
jgi:hypothetical protein